MVTNDMDIPARIISEDRIDPKIGFDITRQPKWDIPDKVVIKAAVTGGVIRRARNPNQPYTLDEIRKAAMECIKAGVTSVHIHPRTPDGEDVQDREEFIRGLHYIIDPIKEKYSDNVLVDGCALLPDFKDEVAVIKTGLLESSPVNPFVMGNITPRRRLQAEAQMMQENGVKPEIAIRCDGDIDRAKCWLIDTRIVVKPLCWLLLPNFALGGTALPNAFAMAENLMWQVRQIREIEPESVIMVCMAGRASSYLSTMAMLLGLQVRVGMEDTYFKWPHKEDIIESNAKIVADTMALANILGRKPATANEYRALMGLPQR